MKLDKDYWEPVCRDFCERYPDYVDDIVDWYPSGQMEIVIKTNDGRKYIYDCFDQQKYGTLIPIESSDNNEEEWRNIFSKNLIRKIYRCGMTQDMLAYEIGVTPVMINRYVKGRATPSAYMLKRIADTLRCSFTELVY